MNRAHIHNPAHLTNAEALAILGNPAASGCYPAILEQLRRDAWARLKADHIARQRRQVIPFNPTGPKDAA